MCYALSMLLERVERKTLPVLRVPQYDVTVRRFNDWLEGRPVTDETVRDFFRELERDGYSARSIRLAKVAIKAAVLKAFPSHDSRVRASLDALFRSIKVALPESHVQETDVFTKRELETLVEDCPERLGLFVRALYNTGSRISELLSVRLKSSVRDRSVYRCRITGKGKRERTLVIDRELFEGIQKAYGSKDFLFAHNGKRYSRQYLAREIKKHALRSLGRDIHPHALRHSRITHLLRDGKPVDAVSRFAGHSTPGTTLKFYAHTLLSAEEILETGL